MQVRTQLVIVGLIAVGWAAGNFAVVHPVLAESGQANRRSLARLESAVARDPNDLMAARELSQRYVDLEMPRLAVDTMAHMDRSVQHDARVILNVARAYERLGEVEAATARINGAASRCESVPPELAPGAGCDARTQMELAVESSALERMMAWHITPLTDPDRAQVAHELALRPIHLAGTFR